jgi:hypothetical protein
MILGMGRRSSGRAAAGRARSLLLWAALGAALASPALAATTPQPPKVAAEDPLARAQAAIDAADCPAAVRILTQSYQARPPPRALMLLGYCHRKEGALDQAAQDYTRLIQDHPSNPLAKRAQELLVHVEEERIGRRARSAEASRSASGTPLVATAAPATTAVVLPATSTVAAPLPLPLPLPPQQPQPISASGTPPATVVAAPEPVSATSAGPSPIPFDPTEPDPAEARIAAPERAALPPPLPPAAPEPEGRVWSWVAAAGAAAALGTGAVFVSAANSTKSEYETQVAPRARKDELASQFDTQRSRAGLLLVTGAVLAASAGLLFVLHF